MTLDHFGESQTSPTFEMNPLDLFPSWKNEKVYKPVNRTAPDIRALAEDIRKNGILEPLVISADNYILSGHRRREAALLAGLSSVPCRIEKILHDDPEFMQRLISYNAQRVKSRDELLREVIAQVNPDEAYRQLIEERKKAATMDDKLTIRVGQRRDRKKISKLKSDMVQTVTRVIYQSRNFWPLSDRRIHCRLLNSPPLRNVKGPESVYRNDRKSYQDLCDLLTRLRLDGSIPMSCIADPARPTTNWYVHSNPQDFAREEFGDLLKGYRRDLQRSQPLCIEVIAEKMTVQSIIKPVCSKYNIPYTIGRGYASLPARAEIVSRFKKSGKDRLCLIVLSDFDPEGINVGESLLQSLRQDFDLYNAQAVRAGLNPEHVQGLADNPTEAKKKSSRYRAFVERFGEEVYELEALTPEKLQKILTEAIDRLLDIDAFNAELDAEKQDAAYLQAVRQAMNHYFSLLEIEWARSFLITFWSTIGLDGALSPSLVVGSEQTSDGAGISRAIPIKSSIISGLGTAGEI